MKQHITPEQLQELTPEQQERLREWWTPGEGDRITTGESVRLVIREAHGIRVYDTCGVAININNCLPLLSIGQMFELLFDRCPRVYGWTYYNDDRDLADKLWQAVKEAL